VLDAFTESGSLRALWAAACLPSHDPRRPFPLHSMAHFCVGGSVEVAFHVGGLNAVRECEYRVWGWALMGLHRATWVGGPGCSNTCTLRVTERSQCSSGAS
jgi:hypothetical protein